MQRETKQDEKRYKNGSTSSTAPNVNPAQNYHPPDLSIYILIIVGEILLASQSCMHSGRRSKVVQNLLQSSRSTTTAAAAGGPL
jgi:predicted lipase